MKKIDLSKIDEKKLEKAIDKAIEEGAVYATLYFDLHGKTKDRLKEMGTGFVSKIIDYPSVIFAKGDIEEPIENNGMYSAPMNVNVLVNDFPALVRLCIDYTPFSIEIQKPTEIRLDIPQLHEILMDVSSTSLNYKKYIVERVMTPKDKEVYLKTVKNREELGKRLIERSKGKEKKG